MGVLLEDLRYGVRKSLKNPGFTLTVILVLAFGIGANSAIFSVVSAVLLRPLPWKDSDRIVMLWETNPKRGVEREIVSAANYLDWRDQNRSFEQAAGWRFLYFNLTGRDEPERVQGLIVTANFFPMLRVNAALGRTFLPEEERPGQDKVVVLGNELWQRRFGSDPRIVGQKITVEGEPHTVVGVLPADFWMFQVLNRKLDMYVPMAFDPGQIKREDHAMFVYARLSEGVTIEQAQAEMSAIYGRLEQSYPKSNEGLGASVVSVQDQWTATLRPALLLLLAAAGFVLLIACANVANLLLARATARQKESAVKMALGATRSRLMRELLTESVMLALAGGAAGLLVSLWAVNVLNDLIPQQAVHRVGSFRVDEKVLGFTLAVSVVTGVIFGIAPALQSSRLSLSESLKEAARSASAGLRGRKLRSLLVVSEVALAVMLLVAAALAIRSVLGLQGVHRGLDPNNVLTMQIWLPRARYTNGQQVARFYSDVLQRVERLPGVRSAAAVNFPPLALQSTTAPFTIEGRAPAAPGEELEAQCPIVSPEYFSTMGIPLLRGRTFNDQDADETRGVVIISENFARRFWPGEDPLGKRIKPRFPDLKTFWIPESRNLWLTVVGVVGDVDRAGLSDRLLPEMYLPAAQNPSSIMSLVVRTESDPLQWAEAVRNEVYAVDPDQPVFDIKTMEAVAAASFADRGVLARLLGAFASLALILAAAGIYGVMSYTVTQRTREIGIRMALGASSANVLGLVIGQGLKLVLSGVALGLAGAFITTRVMSSILYGVSATDPATFISIAVMLAAVAVAACYIPARRSLKVNPMITLRHE